MVNSVNSNHNNNLNVQSINLAGLQGAVASLPLQSIQVKHLRTLKSHRWDLSNGPAV